MLRRAAGCNWTRERTMTARRRVDHAVGPGIIGLWWWAILGLNQ